MEKSFENYPKYRRIIGNFISIRTGTTINFYSALMRDLLYLLETDPLVTNYRAGRTTLFYLLEGNYVPFRCDFEIACGLFEEHLLINDGYSERELSAIQHSYVWRDVEFSIVNKTFVRRQPNLLNAKLLYRYARQPISANGYAAFNKFFAFRESSSLVEFQSFLGNENLNPTIALTLLFHRHLQHNPDEPLDGNSKITIARSLSLKEVYR